MRQGECDAGAAGFTEAAIERGGSMLSDPFHECVLPAGKLNLRILGARFSIESNSPWLLQLTRHAFDGLPVYRLPGRPPHLTVRLLLNTDKERRVEREPASLAMFSGKGLVGGATAASDFVMICPELHTALVSVSSGMRQFPYHTRYELIEFAAYALAARAQRLVPLHAAAVGCNGIGALLMGASGAGKSTLALLALMGGMEFLAEDSVLLESDSMLAVGLPAFLHVKAEALHWIQGNPVHGLVRRSPVIYRRSGARKFEFDLRGRGFRLARNALNIDSLVFLSRRSAPPGRRLIKLTRSEALRRLTAEQPYAAARPEWRDFVSNSRRMRAFELRRGAHPEDSITALRELLS